MEPRPLPALTLIDPELGRLVVGQNRPGPIRVTCRFARAFDIGGGEQDRAAALGSVESPVVVPPSALVATRVADGGGAGTYVLEQSTITAAAAASTCRMAGSCASWPATGAGRRCACPAR